MCIYGNIYIYSRSFPPKKKHVENNQSTKKAKLDFLWERPYNERPYGFRCMFQCSLQLKPEKPIHLGKLE